MSTETLIQWLTQTGLAVTALVLIVLLIRRPFARLFGAGAAYSLWSLPVARLFLPELTVPVSFIKAPPSRFLPVDNSTETYSQMRLTSLPESTSISAFTTWVNVLLFIWVTGVVLWLGFHLVQHVRLKQNMMRNSRPAPLAFAPLTYKTRRQVGVTKEINIRLSHNNTGPLVIGCLKPLIILPRNFMQDYSQDQQYFALAHELAHIKRGDLWVAMLGLIFRALNWPNPLIHFAARKFRSDQEAACDAYVLARLGGTQDVRAGYAETLIHAAKHTLPHSPTPLGLTIYHPLKERLMTLKTSNTAPGFLARILASTCLVATLAITAPINLAAADGHKLAGETHAKIEGKQVIKWVEDNDGVRSEKHYEILSDNGAKTAYKISKDGSRTMVPLSEVDALKNRPGMPDIPDVPYTSEMGDDVKVIIMEGEDGADKKVIKKRVTVMGDHDPMEHHMDQHMGQHKRVVVKSMKEGQQNGHTQVYAFSSDDDVTIDIEGEGYAHAQGGSHSKMMVDVAAEMLTNVNEDDISAKAKRKLEKARKAVKEAQEALEAEE